MAMVGVDPGSLYRRTHSLSRLAWSWVGGRLAPFYIHQMNRVNSQWLCHDDSIVLDLLLLLIRLQSNGPLYSHTVIGTLAVDGWAVTFGTARRGLGGLRPRPVPSSLYQM